MLSVRCFCDWFCSIRWTLLFCTFFFFNDTATTEIYTLSLHDALPIYGSELALRRPGDDADARVRAAHRVAELDRKSTRLNSSHLVISYAVFCLKKKKKNNTLVLRHLIIARTRPWRRARTRRTTTHVEA